jgi:hypothetical protein
VVVVSITLVAIATLALIIPIFGLIGLLGYFEPRYETTGSKCFYLFAFLGGLWGEGFMLWEAWSFYMLEPWAYHSVKAWSWTPLLWLATGFGKRLRDKDVLDAFGIFYDE